MLELAKQFIGQDCIIYFLGSSTVSGVIKEISESGNAILIQNGKLIGAINYANPENPKDAYAIFIDKLL